MTRFRTLSSWSEETSRRSTEWLWVRWWCWMCTREISSSLCIRRMWAAFRTSSGPASWDSTMTSPPKDPSKTWSRSRSRSSTPPNCTAMSFWATPPDSSSRLSLIDATPPSWEPTTSTTEEPPRVPQARARPKPPRISRRPSRWTAESLIVQMDLTTPPWTSSSKA